MNRKQKVAVVVGVVVVAGLALFPPWVLEGDAYSEFEPWRLTLGPAFLFSPPEAPGARVEMMPPVSTQRREISREDLEQLRRFYVCVEPDWATLLPHVAGVLALTVAAVVVLKERKP